MAITFLYPQGFTLFFILVTSSFLYSPCNGSRILLVSTQIRSHIHEQLVVGQELVARGHEVYTVLRDDVHPVSIATTMGIKALSFHVPSGVTHFRSNVIVEEMSKMVYAGAKPDKVMSMAMNITLSDCRYMLEDDHMVNELRHLPFDLAVADGFPLSPCSLLLPEYLGIPFIVMSTVIMDVWLGVPALPSFVPMRFLECDDQMSWGEKLANTILFVAFSDIGILSKIMHSPALCDTTLLMKYAPAYRDFIYLHSNAGLYISTSDHILESPAPSMPHLIRIPGITQCPAKPLHGTFKTTSDKATKGLIVMSFGTSTLNMPENIVFKFLTVFRNLTQTVIWKFPDFPKHLENHVSSNVVILPWLPQNDLLGHPNTKVFITHCGNNGQYEAIYHGVPMIGFPLFAEQPHNAHRMVSKGYGIKMNILTFESSELWENIMKLMNNETIRENVAKAGKISKSRMMLPREEAAYWVEHVLEFGSDHLRSSAQTMPMYKLYMLDIIACTSICVISVITIIMCTGCYCWRRFGQKSKMKIDIFKKRD